ncbi:MAG: MaoC family dehydratase, partial [Acidimicrobiia bacterium]|nr:MaoC family dehydratase [Acidimicrobiia bacterium]
MSPAWPQPLEPVIGPFSDARIEGAAAGMGEHGAVTRALVADGLVPPDLITGMTLFLLARQPRTERSPVDGSEESEQQEKDKASPIAGGVWAREQFTIHRPLGRTDAFTVSGEATGRYVRKGRRYGTTTSVSHDSGGALVATNLTTGLLSYRAVDGLADGTEGLALADTPAPVADRAAAEANPHVEQLRGADVGEVLGGAPLVVSLAMMAARDTASPDNPIHSDLEAARKAGLERPIAGGSHVLAFALEPILARFGPGVLFHGAHLDARWKAPTHADATIVPRVEVTRVDVDRVVLAIDVTLGDGPSA